MWRWLLFFPALASAQQPAMVWYNGDWRSGIPGMANWYVSDGVYSRTYDDFVVPFGGWTITSVFSNNNMSPTGVTDAAWEIRTGMAAGNPGAVVASGRGAATLTKGASAGEGVYCYRVQVDGLSVQLPPGRYWLSVSPVTPDQKTYLNITLGANAVGDPPGNNKNAFYCTPAQVSPAQGTGGSGTSGDYSLGIYATLGTGAVETGWRANVTSMVQQMTTLHSQPYPGVSVSDFNAAAAALWSRIDTIPDPVARTEFERLVASINDPHTTVSYPAPAPFQMVPLSFYWFDDGIYVTGAAAPYQSLLGGRVVRVGGRMLADVIARLTPLIAHDNDSWIRYVLPQRLANLDFLYGTGIASQPDRVAIDVDTAARALPAIHHRPGGGVAHVQSMIVTAGRAPLLAVYQGLLPLYRQHTDRNYWSTVIDDGATVYFQYNHCIEDTTQASAEFLAALDQTLAEPTVRRLIVDMRNNTGGSAMILDPWIDRLKATRFNSPGRLYVIVGRATFSAAMEATNFFHDRTAAIFVGEPPGAKPRFLLRRGDFPVPYFGIRVSYSTGTENANLDGPALFPDIPAAVTFRDYMAGVDPALDAILRIPPPAN